MGCRSEAACVKMFEACDLHYQVAGPSKECISPVGSDQCDEKSLQLSFDDILSPRSARLMRGASRDAVGLLREMNDFEFIELLGQGFFGKVYKVQEKSDDVRNGGLMVMKVPILHNLSSRTSSKKIVIKEDYMLRRLKHPNILRSRGICVQRSSGQWQLNLLVDFCDAGSLQQLILNTKKPFPWLQRCSIALDICRALDYVHRQGYMHRDLTSMNILLQCQNSSHFPKAVVADFGLSARIPAYPEKLPQVGTQNWMAPEVLKEEFYNEKMIARIDADHDAGLYRTRTFGLDYVRFIARCPPESPLPLLKIAFKCCMLPPSRPSFSSLIDQFSGLVCQNSFPNGNTVPVQDEIRLGRSQSDVAVRRRSYKGATTLAAMATYSPVKIGDQYNNETANGIANGRRRWKLRASNSSCFTSVTRKPQKFTSDIFSLEELRRYDELDKNTAAPTLTTPTIVEDVTSDTFPLPTSFTDNAAEHGCERDGEGAEENVNDDEIPEVSATNDQLTEFANQMAREDPDYQHSEENPFSIRNNSLQLAHNGSVNKRRINNHISDYGQRCYPHLTTNGGLGAATAILSPHSAPRNCGIM